MAQARRVAQLSQRLRLDLANTFASDFVLLANFLKRALVTIHQTKPHFDDAPLTLARLELQARPKKLARQLLAEATPEQCWGLAAFSRELLSRVAGLDVPKVADVVWKATDDAVAWRWFVRQYGPLFRRKRAVLGGSWEEVGTFVGELLDNNNGGEVMSARLSDQPGRAHRPWRVVVRFIDVNGRWRSRTESRVSPNCPLAT